jgi:glutathione S-transferase
MVRYSLNFKGIPYKTEWVEYPDIEALCKKIGAAPTEQKADGSPHYTLPAIYDPSTKTALTDSVQIAKYLDRTYPNTPKLFPPGSKALQHGALEAYFPKLTPLWRFALPPTNTILNPHSQQYFRPTREIMLGKRLEDAVPKGKDREEQWAKLKEGYGDIDAWLQQGKEDGPYFLGNTNSFIDFVVASYLLWVKKVCGEDGPEWNDVKTWNDGRWIKFLGGLAKYEKVV